MKSLLPDQVIAGEWNGQPREPHKLEDNGFDSRARYQICPHRLAARMLGSQPSDAGSSPAGDAGAWRSWSPRGTVNAENAGSSPVVPAKIVRWKVKWSNPWPFKPGISGFKSRPPYHGRVVQRIRAEVF